MSSETLDIDAVEIELDPLEGEVAPEFAAAYGELTQEEIDDRVHQQRQDTVYNRIILPQGATAVDAIKHLLKGIPQNEFGLPAFFYRSDLLPYDLGHFEQSDAEAAIVDLDYSDGLPTYNGGHLFWEKLPHESQTDFLAFQRYVEMADTIGIRTTHILAKEQGLELGHIEALATLFFWRPRARAYDLFYIAANRKLRERRSRTLEDQHFLMAENILNTIKDEINTEKFGELTLKEQLDCVRQLMNMMRISSGLPQNGNAGAVPYNPDAAKDTKNLMEDITKGVQQGDNGLGLGGGLAELLKDPNFAFEAQKIVLRVRHQNDANAQGANSHLIEQPKATGEDH